jgi:hypothetical protein
VRMKSRDSGAPVVVTWVELSCADRRAPDLASGPSV